MTYNKKYFVEKFSAIPEELWCQVELTDEDNPDCHCAMGHCGLRSEHVVDTTKTEDWPEEALALAELVRPISGAKCPFARVYNINDGNIEQFGNNPKANILKALNQLPD
jgi:hypothetical protein